METEIISIQQALQTFPDGKILCCRNGNYYKWMLACESRKPPVYIPKRERSFAQQMTFKKYLTYRKEEAEDELRALDFYLRHHNTSIPKSEQMLTSHPEYQKLLSPHFKPLSQELEEWASLPYEHCTHHTDSLIHKTSSGIYVRSESESLIETFLYINKIPFRYECILTLGDTICYPSFTIRHPETGQFFYWEHFSHMDDPEYNYRVAPKLDSYIKYGIIPSINLITTFETPDHPLDPNEAEQLIQQYFN